MPSVIRLRYFVRVPFQRRCTLSRRAVFARDEHRCQYCGEHADSIDHVMPRSRGGQHVWENVVAACRACNIRKRDRLLEETTMHLARRPSAPRALAWVVVTVGRVPGELGPLPRGTHVALRVTGSWSVERLTGSATELHSRDLPDPVERAVWILEATAPALVLGSTQPWIDVPGLEVCRRRSGGGAVLVRPGEVLWIDVLLPRGDPLWDDDVGRAAHWLGETWRDALGAGLVHTGQMIRTLWSSADLLRGRRPRRGARSTDAKVVGVSQRRTRAGARFQCAVMRDVGLDRARSHLRCG